MRRVLITGSRDWDDRRAVDVAIMDWFNLGFYLEGRSPKDITLVSGGCPTGADRMGELIGNILGFNVEVHPADWKTHGKRAGFIRNSEMVKLGADICFAFIKNGSRGASHTAGLAEKAGIPIIRIEK